MSLTVLQGENNLSVVLDATTDFDMAAYCPRGVRLSSIMFYPAAAGDVLIVREKGVGLVHKWIVKDSVGNGVHRELYPHLSIPFIDRSECTGTITGSIVVFEFLG